MQGRRTLCPAAFISCHISPLVVDNNSRAIHLICLAAIPSHPLPSHPPSHLLVSLFIVHRRSGGSGSQRGETISSSSYRGPFAAAAARARSFNLVGEEHEINFSNPHSGEEQGDKEEEGLWRHRKNAEKRRKNVTGCPCQSNYGTSRRHTERNSPASQPPINYYYSIQGLKASSLLSIYRLAILILMILMAEKRQTEQAVWQNLINFPPDATPSTLVTIIKLEVANDSLSDYGRRRNLQNRNKVQVADWGNFPYHLYANYSVRKEDLNK